MTEHEFPLVGTTIDGKYTLLDGIAAGAMGVVYRAQQRELERDVAVKCLAAELARSPGKRAFHKRFKTEAVGCAKLHHPNTVRVFDHGFLDDAPYIVMELLSGNTLRAMVRHEGRLPVLRAIHIAKQMAGSLAEAHREGLVHRDLKPDNVLICPQVTDADFVKVVDFGLAKVVQRPTPPLIGIESPRIHPDGVPSTGMVGSPHFASPEQILALAVDGRADVYALGACMYFMLVGENPYPAGPPQGVLSRQLTDDLPELNESHPELGLPSALSSLIHRCMARDREDRVARIEHVLNSLTRLEAQLLTQNATPPRQAHRAPEPPRRRGRTGLLAGLVALGLAAAAGLGWYGNAAIGSAAEPARLLRGEPRTAVLPVATGEIPVVATPDPTMMAAEVPSLLVATPEPPSPSGLALENHPARPDPPAAQATVADSVDPAATNGSNGPRLQLKRDVRNPFAKKPPGAPSP